MSTLFNNVIVKSDDTLDIIYFFVRDRDHLQETKEYIENLWKEFEPICENIKEFKSDLTKSFSARVWEMYLGVNLKNNSNIKLLPKENSKGPDFNIIQNEKLIHIEAICPKCSKEVREELDETLNDVRDSRPGNDNRKLILTGALSTKINQYNDRLKKGIVKETTPYIIAINAGDALFTSQSHLTSVLFDIGDMFYEIDKKSGKIVNVGHHKKEKVVGLKDGKSKEIPANLFLSEYGRCISAIIFSGQDICNKPREFGADLCVIPNPYAHNKISTDLFKSGTEYFVENGMLKSKRYFSKRKLAIESLVNNIYYKNFEKVLKVAIDGVDGAGKSFLALELKQELEKYALESERVARSDRYKARKIIHTSIDYFHNPRERRYIKGRYSPLGFYEDSYNYEIFKDKLLRPLEKGKNHEVQLRYFDVQKNDFIEEEKKIVPSNAILIVDGIFLNRDELVDEWDISIFIDADFNFSVNRSASRDNISSNTKDPLVKRYVDGQKIYLEKCKPRDRANFIFYNNDFEKVQVSGL